MTRRRGVAALAALLAAVLAAGCGGGGGGTTSTTTATATTRTATTTQGGASAAQGAISVRIVHAGGHHPVAGHEWPLDLRVTKGGRGLSGRVTYAFAINGQVVAHRPGVRFRDGRYHDTLSFPPEATGHQITLQIVVTTPQGRRTVSYTVTPRRG